MSVEEWRDVVGFEGRYEVSNVGRVAGLTRGRRRVLAQFLDACGYYRLGLYVATGRRVNKRVHTLVAEAFIGARPSAEAVARHLDGDPTHNSPSNLRWGTVSENVKDSIAHGTQRNIRKTHCPRNHEYDAANTRIEKKGNRKCRTCYREAARNQRAKAKKATA